MKTFMFIILSILCLNLSFANMYESEKNGIPTFSNTDSDGAKKLTIQKPEVINSYREITNPNETDALTTKETNKTIIWNNKQTSDIHISKQDLNSLESSLENFTKKYQQQA